MTANILEQFNIKEDFKFKDTDRQRQYLELLRKAEIAAKDRTFEELNDDIEFLVLLQHFLETTVDFIKSEPGMIERDSTDRLEGAWNKDQIIDFFYPNLGMIRNRQEAEVWVDDHIKIADDGEIELDSNLTLRELVPLTPDIPPYFIIRGSLDIGNSRYLKRLPKGLSLTGDLNLRGCSEIEELPDDILIGGQLMLDQSTAHLFDQAFDLRQNRQIDSVILS